MVLIGCHGSCFTTAAPMGPGTIGLGLGTYETTVNNSNTIAGAFVSSHNAFQWKSFTYFLMK